MNPNSRWMSATVVFVVASLMMAGLKTTAFAGTADEVPQSEERVVTSVPSVKLPGRPAIMTTSVAQAIPQSQVPVAAASTPRSPYTPPAKQSTGKSKKWIWIIAAAAGAFVVTGVVLAGGDDDDNPPTPTIQIGAPTVGQPQ